MPAASSGAFMQLRHFVYLWRLHAPRSWRLPCSTELNITIFRPFQITDGLRPSRRRKCWVFQKILSLPGGGTARPVLLSGAEAAGESVTGSAT